MLFVSFPALPPVRALIASRREARFNETGRTLTRTALLQGAAGCDVLMVSVPDKLTEETIGALPASVRTIATYSVGYEHVDVAAAKARGIAVLHTPDVLANAVAMPNAFIMPHIGSSTIEARIGMAAILLDGLGLASGRPLTNRLA